MNPEKITEWLRGSPAFENAPDEAIAELSNSFTERKIAAGKPVVCEGDNGGEFYLLASGSATVSAEKGGEETYLGNISVGGIFGEIASLTGGRRMASVVAAEDCLVLAMPQDVFQAAVKAHPELATSVLKSLERYLVP